ASNFTRILDLISTIPVGQYFQGFRLFRLTRLIKLIPLVIRAKRYEGPGKSLVRVFAIVGATTFAGAYTIMIVEGSSGAENVSILSFGDALWWSLVTISTVGYGDLYPVTPGGRIVAVFLILVGVGVCGYIAGFMAKLMSTGDYQEEMERLVSVEEKLDRLAHYFEIEGWPHEETPEKKEFVYRKSS
ncbi:MAG: ion channel, partial [Myxococcota bacterium]|nr:ion channel [Myxococcota bacterium]